MSKPKIIREVIRVHKEMSVDVEVCLSDTIEDNHSITNTKFFNDIKDAESYAGEVTGDDENFWMGGGDFLVRNLDQIDPDCKFGEVEIVDANVTKVKVGSLNPYELEVLLHEYPDYEKVLVLKDEVSNGDESH